MKIGQMCFRNKAHHGDKKYQKKTKWYHTLHGEEKKPNHAHKWQN